jgi:hypothetical protein
MKSRGLILGLLWVTILVIAGCGGSSAGDPAQAAENYLRTRVAGDEGKLVALGCKARESDVRGEALSFGGMKANIESLTCKQAGTEGEFAVVSCVGKMVTTYAGETRDWDLGARSLKMVQEDGAWKMCGYK